MLLSKGSPMRACRGPGLIVPVPSERNPAIAAFLAPQPARVQQRRREPGEGFRHALHDHHGPHGVDRAVSDIEAALESGEAALRQVAAHVRLGVFRAAIEAMAPELLLIEGDQDRIDPAASARITIQGGFGRHLAAAQYTRALGSIYCTSLVIV